MRRTLAFVCALGIAGPAFAQNQINGSPISQLPQATTPLSGTELVPLVQGETTKQTPLNSLPGGFGGFTGSKTAGSCTFTITNGLITAVAGC